MAEVVDTHCPVFLWPRRLYNRLMAIKLMVRLLGKISGESLSSGAVDVSPD